MRSLINCAMILSHSPLDSMSVRRSEVSIATLIQERKDSKKGSLWEVRPISSAAGDSSLGPTRYRTSSRLGLTLLLVQNNKPLYGQCCWLTIYLDKACWSAYSDTVEGTCHAIQSGTLFRKTWSDTSEIAFPWAEVVFCGPLTQGVLTILCRHSK